MNNPKKPKKEQASDGIKPEIHTTQTPFPLDLFFGWAGHMGLVGKCSGNLNSNKAALRYGPSPGVDAADGC